MLNIMIARGLMHIVNSKIFKRIYAVLAVILMVLGLRILIDPAPFLRFGYAGIFVFNTLGGWGTYLVPTLAMEMNLYGVAAATALGMTFNDSLGWLVGKGGTAFLEQSKRVRQVATVLRKYGIVALFIMSALPVPYDLVGVLAGYLGIPYQKFFIATVSGKFIRMLLIGWGARWLLKIPIN